MNIDDKECLNFATFNFLGFVGNEKIEVCKKVFFLKSCQLRMRPRILGFPKIGPSLGFGALLIMSEFSQMLGMCLILSYNE